MLTWTMKIEVTSLITYLVAFDEELHIRFEIEFYFYELNLKSQYSTIEYETNFDTAEVDRQEGREQSL